MTTHTHTQIPRVLTIAGTDPTGGAGIQADIKSITAAGGFAYSVTTALVAQNTQGVQEIFTPPVDFLRAQLRSVADDVTIDAIKVGMLGSREVTEIVQEFLRRCDCPVVVDPVMIASSGDRLLEADAEAAVHELTRCATVITPNLPELAVLADTAPASTLEEAVQQAQTLAGELGVSVLVKGGHLTGDTADNALVSPDGTVDRVPVHRVDTTNTHGTGCSLSSALATRLAAGDEPCEAVTWATRWLHEAISNTDNINVGHGNGPIDHSHTARRMQHAASTQPWRHSPAAPTDPILPAAGPHTEALWKVSAPLLTEIMELPFIKHLQDGTLRREDFLFYLKQDALYLQRYAEALTTLGGQWAVDANGAIAAEQEMQDTWLAGTALREEDLSPVTRGYTDFLLTSTYARSAALGQAAVLPCYWLYNEVGMRLAAANHPDHPYHSWLATYSSDEFTESTKGAIARVEEAMAADPDNVDAAIHACFVAARYEVEFFDQADRAWVVPERQA